MDEYFNKGLSNFIKDFACKNEIIAKFNNKKPISKIKQELTYKISEEDMIDMIWQYLLEKNIVLKYDIDDKKNEQYDIVKKQDEFGKMHYEKVKSNIIKKEEYIFVKVKELDKNKYNDYIKELIDKLPWKKEGNFIRKEFLTEI